MRDGVVFTLIGDHDRYIELLGNFSEFAEHSTQFLLAFGELTSS